MSARAPSASSRSRRAYIANASWARVPQMKKLRVVSVFTADMPSVFRFSVYNETGFLDN